MQISLHDHLDYKQDSQNFISGPLVGFLEFAGEDVAKAEEAFGELVVGSAEVEYCQGDRVDWCGGCESVEMFDDVVLKLSVLGWRVLHSAWRRDTSVVCFAELDFQFGAETSSEGREEASQDVWKEDTAEDVSSSAYQGWETLGVCFDLNNITVLLS